MYCKKCGSKIDDDSIFCSNCGLNIRLKTDTEKTVFEKKQELKDDQLDEMDNSFVDDEDIARCPKCGSDNIQYQLVSVAERRGCLTILLIIFLALTVVGIPLMIIYLLLRGKKTDIKKYCVCQSCGHEFRPLDKLSKELLKISIVVIVFLIIAYISTLYVNNIINDSKENTYLYSVEGYAKAVEYAVMEYEYYNNGELPLSYCDIKKYINYKEASVVCDVTISHTDGSVKLEHCKVGVYKKHSYKYDSSKHKGAEIEKPTSFASLKSCY